MLQIEVVNIYWDQGPKQKEENVLWPSAEIILKINDLIIFENYFKQIPIHVTALYLLRSIFNNYHPDMYGT